MLNFLALLAMAGLTYMGAARGLYRSALTLASLVLAGTIAFGLMGPLAGQGPADAHSGAWYYSGDAFVLWAVFCVAFLAIRAAADKLTPADDGFALWPSRIGGGILGAMTGYLAVGISVILIQMLPTPPAFLGYEAFRFVKREDAAKSHVPAPKSDVVLPGDGLLLGWDRGTFALFNFASGGALGSDGGAVVRRYGDVYPPPEMRAGGYHAVVDADDVFYYHWYRRNEYAGSGAAASPLPEAGRSSTSGRGMALKRNEVVRAAGFDVRAISVRRIDSLTGFAGEVPPADSDFLLVSVRFAPAGPLPAKIDSAQFYLLHSMGNRVGGPPMILGGARPAGEGKLEPDVGDTAADTTPRDLKYATIETNEGPASFYLMNGAAFEFADPSQFEVRGLVFTIPKSLDKIDYLRLMVDTKLPVVAPTKGAPAATSSAAGKAAPAATPSAAGKAVPAATPSGAGKAAPAATPSSAEKKSWRDG